MTERLVSRIWARHGVDVAQNPTRECGGPRFESVRVHQLPGRKGSQVAGKNAGRSGGRMTLLRRQVRATETHCYRCGQRIDWSIPYVDEQGNGNPEAGTVEHVQPLSTHPHLAEDLGNLKASHARCNNAAGNRAPRPGLGIRSREW